MFKKSKEISVKIDILNKDQSLLKKKLDNILSSLPNLPLKDIPIGKDESSNKEVKKVGNIQKFDFKAKSHLEIGENLKMLDFELASKTTGSRFVFVKGQLALLERVIKKFHHH